MFKNSYSNYFHTSDNVRIFYTNNFGPKKLSENDQLIIFNYGLVCNNTHWGPQIKFFEELGYNILIHDYRGHYSSSGLESIKDITFSNIAKDIYEMWQSFGSPYVFMLGHSMGVNVTLEYSKLYPSKLLGQVLLSGTVLPPQDIMFDTNFFGIFFPYIDAISKKFPTLYSKLWNTSFMNPLIKKIVHNGGFNTKNVPMEFIEIYLKRIGELPPHLFNQLVQQMHDHDIINHLEKINVPTLIIGGDKDKMIPNYLQNILHQHLSRSQLYIVKDGSHVPQIDFPETINKRIYSFLKSLT